MNKKVWAKFWDQFQQDVATVLQNNILNFAVFLGAVMLYIKIKKPQYYTIVADFANTYLLAKGVKK